MTQTVSEPAWLTGQRASARERYQALPVPTNREEASAMIVSGFVEPITKELPLEYAVELNRLIQLQMEGSVG
jgi:Fe-S cluster assembly protein SufB